MALANPENVVLGSIAFAVFWIMAVFPALPFLPIGRTEGSLLGAMLMVLFQVITPKRAYAEIDLPILGLLFGTMVVSVYLERAEMFRYLEKLTSWKSRGGKDLIFRICVVSAISSALFTNDTSCVVLTEFVLKLAREHNLPSHPFLLALASSSNIGSSATPIGNPQNLIISVQSGISFGKFFLGLIPSVLMGVVVNSFLIILIYWKLLSSQKVEASEDVEMSEDVISLRFSPAIFSLQKSSGSICSENERYWDSKGSSASSGNIVMLSAIDVLSDPRSVSSSGEMGDPFSEKVSKGVRGFSRRWRGVLWKPCVYLVTLGMLVSFIMGVDMSWSAITAAILLLAIDFKDAHPSLEKVSYSLLLVFFCGMFVTVEGFNSTGMPGALWNFLEPYAHINHASGVAVLALVLLVVSNLASNVPAGISKLFVHGFIYTCGS